MPPSAAATVFVLEPVLHPRYQRSDELGKEITELCGYIYAATHRLLEMIREFDQDVTVVLFTAYDDAVDVRRAILELGAYGYLTKSTGVEGTRTTIQQALRSRGVPSARSLPLSKPDSTSDAARCAHAGEYRERSRKTDGTACDTWVCGFCSPRKNIDSIQ